MNEVRQEAEAEDARSKLQSAIINKVIRNRLRKPINNIEIIIN